MTPRHRPCLALELLAGVVYALGVLWLASLILWPLGVHLIESPARLFVQILALVVLCWVLWRGEVRL